MHVGSMIALVLTTLATAGLSPGDYRRTLIDEGVPRDYWVHVPPGYDAAKPTPVVLLLHSAMTNGPMMARFCGMSDKADQANFIAVYPNGTGTTPFIKLWDAGGVRGKVSDDVGFLSRVLDDLETVVHVDPKRVYAAGMSLGGMMCYRLAAELSDRIAAIAAVSGTMAIDEVNPKRPVPVLHFHGTKDGLVHYNGPDAATPSNIKFLSVDQTISAWARINGCADSPAVDVLPRSAEGPEIRREAYGPGTNGAEVVLYTIEGGGHTWPGRPPRAFFLGETAKNLSANDIIWDFFLRHPMK